MCKKCGMIQEMVPKYCRSCRDSFSIPNPAGINTSETEHLHLICSLCGFSTIVPTMDNRKEGETY